MGREAGAEVGGACRWDPNTLAGGGARGVREGRSRKELQVFSLSGKQVRGLGEDSSSQPRLGLGGEAAVGLGLRRTWHSHLQRRLNSSTFTFLGCGKCFITRSRWWSSLLNISPVGNSHPNQYSRLHEQPEGSSKSTQRPLPFSPQLYTSLRAGNCPNSPCSRPVIS